MKFKIILFFLTTISCLSCSTDTINSKSTKTISYTNDSISSTSTVLDFLNWYKISKTELDTIEFVKNIFNADSLHPFRINFMVTEQYLEKLNSSKLVSELFLGSLRDYFKYCDSIFVVDKEFETPPFGLDFDLIMKEQADVEYDLENLDKVVFENVSINNNKAIVKIKFNSTLMLSYFLIKLNNNWLIEGISDK